MTIHFDEAWYRALSLADAIAGKGSDVVAVRDLIGRVNLVLDDRPAPIDEQELNDIRDRLMAVAGNFTGTVTPASTLIEPEQIVASEDLVVRRPRKQNRGMVAILERRITGANWDRLKEDPPSNRVVLYGFRGGVGRSTATFILAQHFAMRGRSVLVIDLDLESPGIGALLQTAEDLPDYGIIDHLVEAAAGNEDGLHMVTRSRLAQTQGNGEVWLAAAGGRARTEYDYLPKLNRIYADIPNYGDPGRRTSFGDRLERAVTECEHQVTEISRAPDVVLLDSRSGIHDIAAVAITQLSDLSLLFAADSADTWAGYRALFEEWARSPQDARTIRERLRMVAAFVPARSEETYLLGFRDHAQACFADTLYDDVPSGALMSSATFNAAPEDEDAPHSPLPILFASELVGLDTATDRDWSRSDFVEAAYRRFVDGVGRLVLGSDV